MEQSKENNSTVLKLLVLAVIVLAVALGFTKGSTYYITTEGDGNVTHLNDSKQLNLEVSESDSEIESTPIDKIESIEKSTTASSELP